MTLRKKTLAGLLWAAASQGGKQLSQFVIAVILARLLSPRDFGLMAMAMVFIDIFTIIGELGISSALIQKQDVTDIHYSSAFWLNIGTGALLTMCFSISAPFIAAFYGRPELRFILTLLSCNFLLSSLSLMQQTILMKELEFRKLAIRDIISVILSGLVGIYMAMSGLGVLSLVGQTLSFALINAVLLWLVSRWRPKLVFSKAHMREIFVFSANLTGSYMANVISRNIDKLLIGKFLGDQALGIYSLAYKLMLYPLQNVSWVIGRVMFPAFSKIQDDMDKIRHVYMQVIRIVSLITFPMMAGLLVIAPEFVHLLFGSKWESAVVIIRIFCICGMFQSISATGGTVILSQNRADLQFKLQISGSVTMLFVIIIGMQWGINGIAILYAFQSWLFLYGTFYTIGRIVDVSCRKLHLQLINSFVYSLAMTVVILAIRQVLELPDSFKLSIIILSGIVAYVLILIKAKEIAIENKKLILRAFSTY